MRKNNTVSPGETQTRISCPPRYCSDERGVGVERPLMRFLVLVLVLSEAVLVLELEILTGGFVSVGSRHSTRLLGVGKAERPSYAISRARARSVSLVP